MIARLLIRFLWYLHAGNANRYSLETAQASAPAERIIQQLRDDLAVAKAELAQQQQQQLAANSHAWQQWQSHVQRVQDLQQRVAAARRHNERLQAALVAATSERTAQRRELQHQQRLLLKSFDVATLGEVATAADHAATVIQQQASLRQESLSVIDGDGRATAQSVIRIGQQQNILRAESGDFLGGLQAVSGHGVSGDSDNGHSAGSQAIGFIAVADPYPVRRRK